MGCILCGDKMTKGQIKRTIPTSARAVGTDRLDLRLRLPVRALNAGLFVSRGVGMHPERVIDSHELIFVQRGALGMREDDRQFTLGPGQTLLLWPGRRHGGTVPYPPDLSFYWVHFTLEPGRGGFSARIPQTATLRRPERMVELFRRFLDDQESGWLAPQSGACLIVQMLLETSRNFNDIPAVGPSCLSLASRAEAYIRTNFGRSISASGIARALRCNPDYLGRVFRAAYGRTLTGRLHRCRVNRARALLMESGASAKEIAAQCGFSDAVYFRRIFRRECGMSPAVFRRLYARVRVNTV